MNLTEKNWVIVGPPGALLRGVAQRATEAGATVIWGLPPGDEAAGEAGGGSVIAADVSQEAEVERLFDEAADQLWGIHAVIVQVAGAEALDRAPLADLELAAWNEALAAALRVPFLIARRAVNEFVAGGEGGRLVFVLPAAGEAATTLVEPALRAMARSIAKEYGRRAIACNVVIAAGEGHDTALADTVLFLASDDAAFVNGEVLRAGSLGQ